MILISILELKTWRPLSETLKFRDLFEALDDSELKELQNNFADWILFHLIIRIKRAVYEQRFPVRYKPLNKQYAESKKNKGEFEGFWQKSGWLIGNIERWYEDREWHIGFRSNEKHPENNQSALMIAQVNEFGSKDGRIPPRPLFTPIAKIMEKSISRFFEEFIKQERKDLVKYLR